MSNPDNQCGYCFEYHGKHKPECHAGTLGRIIFGSTQQNNRAGTPNISKSSVCIECDLRQQRLATLEAQLAEVTAERDSFQRIGKHYDEVIHKTADQINQRGTGRTAALVLLQDIPKLVQERDTLRAALRQCAEAETELRIHCELCEDCNSMDTPCDVSVDLQGKLTDALALPVVQAILREE